MGTRYDTQSLIQLAAIIYSDSDDSIRTSKKNVTRKIVQLSIVKNDNYMQTVIELSEYIQNTFGLVFTDDEIWKVVQEYESKFYFDDTNRDIEITTIALPTKEYDKIRNNLEEKSFKSIIKDFYEQHCDKTIPLDKVSDLILSFIYNNFVGNIKNYSNLIEKNSNRYSNDFLLEIKKGLTDTYNQNQIHIINSFIDFEDENKNKYIFYILTLALEYSLTLNLPSGSIPKEIRSKKLYLDSNIIFRALGVNGTNRKSKILLFLDKCLETGQKIIITNHTEKEFESTLEYECRNLDNSSNTTSGSYNYLGSSTDIIAAFLEAKKAQPHINAKYFRAQIQADYQKLKHKYKIGIEYIDTKTIMLDEKDVNSLCKYKYGEESSNFFSKSCRIDVANTKYIAGNTTPDEGNPHVIFITVDRRLLTWTKRHDLYTNLLLFPSDWLSFMLRFGPRSNNVYKSFVDLLKTTPIKEVNLEPNQIETLMSVVNLVEKEPEKQDKILHSMIENQFEEMKKLSDTEDLEEFAIKADVVLSTELKERYKRDIEQVTLDNDTKINEKDTKNEELEKALTNEKEGRIQLKDELNTVKEDNQKLKDELNLEKEIRKKKDSCLRNKKRLRRRILILLIGIIIIPIILKCPFIADILNLKDDTVKTNVLSGLILAGILGVFGYIWKIIFPQYQNTKKTCKEYHQLKED